jgi:hypothetical protein
MVTDVVETCPSDRGEAPRGDARPGEEYRGFWVLLAVVALVILVALAWFRGYQPRRGAASGDFTVRAVMPGTAER